jgi:hypothetical protein
MRTRILGMLVATSIAASACTDVSTDPDAVAALQFDGAGYPSVVVGDSLRDSLGFLLPLSATALNNDGDPIPDADVVYSSPDTVLEMKDGGVVFARGLNPSGAATRVFATVGSLQSQSVSLFTTVRADSIWYVVEADTANRSDLDVGATLDDDLLFAVFGDTAAGKPKVAVQGWLVSFQLRYRGTLLSPTDTSVAYSYVRPGSNTRRTPSFIDTTDAQGRAGRRLRLQTFRGPEDTVFVIATAQRRKTGLAPLTSQMRIIVRTPTSSSRVP